MRMGEGLVFIALKPRRVTRDAMATIVYGPLSENNGIHFTGDRGDFLRAVAECAIDKPPRPLASKRPSACAMGYGRRWQKIALTFRRAHPLCADPFSTHAKEHRIEPSTQVDHIIPRSKGGTDDWNNLQALCASCHSRKTATVDGGFGKTRRSGKA
jgi:5-methylcytosine-specific restriction enzyme A